MITNSNQLLMNDKTLQGIGSTIVSDTEQLALNLLSLWQQPKAALDGAGAKDNDLPSCLQQDFNDYEQKQQLELKHILKKRRQIGQLLSEMENLSDFQNQLNQQSFSLINIYSANNDYSNSSEITSEHLQAPDNSNTFWVQVTENISRHNSDKIWIEALISRLTGKDK